MSRNYLGSIKVPVGLVHSLYWREPVFNSAFPDKPWPMFGNYEGQYAITTDAPTNRGDYLGKNVYSVDPPGYKKWHWVTFRTLDEANKMTAPPTPHTWPGAVQVTGHTSDGNPGNAVLNLKAQEVMLRAAFAQDAGIDYKYIPGYGQGNDACNFVIPVDKLKNVVGTPNAAITAFTPAMGDLVKAEIKRMANLFGKAESIPPTAEPKPETGTNPKYRAALRSNEFKIPPKLWMEGFVTYLLVQPTTGGPIEVVSSLTASDMVGPMPTAAKAQAEYNEKLRKAIAAKAEGQPFVDPGPRPAATSDAALSPDEKKGFDDWWANVSSISKDAATKAGPTAAEAFANYQAGGGTKTKEQWDADRTARIATATAASPSDTGSWVDKLGSALGWAADKAGDAVKWLGDNAVSLAKDWGPAGTVGAYAGIKAVNGLGDTGWFAKWWPALAVGAGFLLLSK